MSNHWARVNSLFFATSGANEAPFPVPVATERDWRSCWYSPGGPDGSVSVAAAAGAAVVAAAAGPAVGAGWVGPPLLVGTDRCSCGLAAAESADTCKRPYLLLRD
jgi:hypothetical protein